MMFDLLRSNIHRYVDLKSDDEDKFFSLFQTVHLRKKEFLVSAGGESRYEYFVNKGCLRTYYLDNKGIEHNIYFAVEAYWISDIYSRTFGLPSLCSIQALENCELLRIPNAALEAFLAEVPALEHFFRLSYQSALATLHLKTIQLLSLSGEERYIYFRNRYPEFDGRIAQKHIASYLGFTPEFFNVVRTRALRRTVTKG